MPGPLGHTEMRGTGGNRSSVLGCGLEARCARPGILGEYLWSIVDICGPQTGFGDYLGCLRVMEQRLSHRVAVPSMSEHWR